MRKRSIQRCRCREGLQAAIQLNIQVDCILRNGLVIEFTDEQNKQDWQILYWDICASGKRQWKEEEWNNHGYTLTLCQKLGYKRTRLIPKLIHGILTL